MSLDLQIALQNQIEALQQQQQALYQQQLASNQVLSFQTPGLAPSRGHRRVQSTVPIGGPGTTFNPIQNQSNLGLGGLHLGLDDQHQGLPRGHGRRHSVNVVNKSGNQGMGSISFGNPYASGDAFEDGFTPPSGAHSRQVSRADSSWRISKLHSASQKEKSDPIQMAGLEVFREITRSPPILLKRRRSYKVFNKSAPQRVATITKCHLLASLTCSLI